MKRVLSDLLRQSATQFCDSLLGRRSDPKNLNREASLSLREQPTPASRIQQKAHYRSWLALRMLAGNDLPGEDARQDPVRVVSLHFGLRTEQDAVAENGQSQFLDIVRNHEVSIAKRG